jgi:hypothetical protein
MAFAFGPNLLGKQILLPVHSGAIISRKKPVEIFCPVVKKGTPSGRQAEGRGRQKSQQDGGSGKRNEL